MSLSIRRTAKRSCASKVATVLATLHGLSHVEFALGAASVDGDEITQSEVRD